MAGAEWPCCLFWARRGKGSSGSRVGPALWLLEEPGQLETVPCIPGRGSSRRFLCAISSGVCSAWRSGLSKRSSKRGRAGQGHSELPARDRNTCRTLDVMDGASGQLATEQARIWSTSGFSSSWKPPKHSLLSHHYVFVLLPLPALLWCRYFPFQRSKIPKKSEIQLPRRRFSGG